jgi:LuxR family maltose regulon positive regulatory protein
MPKAAPYHLRWDPRQSSYTLHDTGSQRALWVAPDSHAWFDGLASVPSFTFSGQHGQLTLRQEIRSGGSYWYAYRRVGQKMAKRYLGRTTELTPARLEQVAAQFAADALSLGQSIHTREVSPAQWVSQHVVTSPIASLPSGMSARSAVPALPASLHDVRLLTKLHIPRLRTQLVHRTHLVERLQQGVERALTLVSAPAGFGKTTLLAQWLAQSHLPVAWLSVEAEDNDPTRFLSYVIAALQTLDAQLGTTMLALLRTPQPPSPETVLAQLSNELVSREGGDVVLVLDDYHLITADPIHRGMTFLLEHLPPQLHLILATRADPHCR